MKKVAIAGCVAFSLTALWGTSSLAQPALVAQGKAKFQQVCAPCHGAGPGDDGRTMLPGTAALQLKYKGAKPPLLEQRTDLPEPVLHVFVRNGVWSMPGFRKTEVTNQEIGAIAAYLADISKHPQDIRPPPDR